CFQPQDCWCGRKIATSSSSRARARSESIWTTHSLLRPLWFERRLMLATCGRCRTVKLVVKRSCRATALLVDYFDTDFFHNSQAGSYMRGSERCLASCG